MPSHCLCRRSGPPISRSPTRSATSSPEASWPRGPAAPRARTGDHVRRQPQHDPGSVAGVDLARSSSTWRMAGGTFVARVDPRQVSDYLETSLGLMSGDGISVEEIIEARELLEVPAAGLAAARRTPEHLRLLTEARGTQPQPRRGVPGAPAIPRGRARRGAQPAARPDDRFRVPRPSGAFLAGRPDRGPLARDRQRPPDHRRPHRGRRRGRCGAGDARASASAAGRVPRPGLHEAG